MPYLEKSCFDFTAIAFFWTEGSFSSEVTAKEGAIKRLYLQGLAQTYAVISKFAASRCKVVRSQV